jgi:hypothetical protein
MDDGGRQKTPWWVKWGGAALVSLFLASIVLAVFGEGHGPGRDFGGGATLVGQSAP